MKKKNKIDEQKSYLINGITYTLKDKYTSKDWGQIIVIISAMGETKVVMGAVGQLLANGDFEKLLNIILDVKDKPIEVLYDDSFESAGCAFNDFMALKKNSIPSTTGSSKN